MTSKIKVDNINKVSDDSNIIKKCGTTTTIGSGASNPIVVDGSAITLGRCGGTVALASGASQTGFGRTGTVDWQTGSIKTSTFTAASGEGYFANTSGGAFNMNLPAGVAGAIVSVADYAESFASNALTIVPNGSDKIGSQNENASLDTKGQSVTLVFVDSTQGWINTMDSTSNVRGSSFIVATGGTITTSGNDKIHTFTGPGTFEITDLSPAPANNVLAYMVVAGGGAGGDGGTGEAGGGAGAGGFREGRNNPITPYTASPLAAACSGLTATVASFPIVVGGGGAPSASGPSGGNGLSGKGSNSVFSTITSAGGGGGISGGATAARCTCVQNGGSGGGGNGRAHPSGNTGNTPPVTPAQGFNGGNGQPAPTYSGGGGGGATALGGNSAGPGAGPGGAGATSSINGTPTARAGGGGGGNQNGPAPEGGSGGSGGGGCGGKQEPNTNVAATVNTGGGGGGNSNGNAGSAVGCGGAGGSGIVIIRYKFQ